MPDGVIEAGKSDNAPILPSNLTDQRPADQRPGPGFSSAAYWEARYRAGGNSGAGSYGRLALFKAAFINTFVALNGLSRVNEFGCGDGNQLGLLAIPHYTGVDVSPTVLERCRLRFPGPGYAFVDQADLATLPPAELGLSLDVIFHLTEDAVFEHYLRTLFALSTDFVIIYASDRDTATMDQHVRHRAVSDSVRRMFPEWMLLAKLPNIYPFDPRRPHDTSFADFMVFGRRHRECLLMIPTADRR
jgi:SAM-dependent methyltransferase